MQTFWQLKEGQGVINLDEFEEQKPFYTRIYDFFRSANYGEIIERSEIERPTHKEFFIKLEKANLCPKCLDVFMMKEYSEVEIVDERSKRSYTIKYIPRSFFRNNRAREHTSNSTVYPADGIDQISLVIDLALFFSEVLRIPIRTITVETEIFLIPNTTPLTVANLVLTMKECENLYIFGKDNVTSAIELLVDHMEVSTRLYVRDVIANRPLNVEKLISVPFTEFCLVNATPSQVLETASANSQITVVNFTIEDFNELILTWMRSDTDRIRRLVMKVSGTSRMDIEKLFANLKVVPGLVPACGFMQRCTTDGCVHHKLRFFFETGIEFHRPDGAIATIFYHDVSPVFNFAMHITYPHTPEITAYTVSQSYDRISRISSRAADKFVAHTKATGATDRAITSPAAANWSANHTFRMKKLKFMQKCHMCKLSNHLYAVSRDLDTVRFVDLRYIERINRKKFGYFVLPSEGEEIEEESDQLLEEHLKEDETMIKAFVRMFSHR